MRWAGILVSILALCLLTAGANAQQVRIGTEANFPPYSFTDRGGRLKGFDIEIGNEICRRANLSCTWVRTDWEGIIQGLNDRSYDVIMSGMAVTSARAQLVLFSTGYQPTSGAAAASLVRVDSDTADVPVVAVQKETVHEEWARARGMRVQSYPSLLDTVEAVWDGRADQALGPQTFLEGAVRNGGGKIEIDRLFTIPTGPTAAAFRKEDVALKEVFDAAILEMLADGSMDRITQKWFAAGDGTE